MPPKIPLDPTVLRRMYLQEDKSTYDIAEQFGISVTTVCQNLREHGIDIKKRKITLPKAVLEKYIKEDRPVTAIAEEFGVGANLVYRQLKECGIAVKGRRIDLPTKILEQMYVAEKKSSHEIADEFGCDTSVVIANLRRANIPIRIPKNKRRAGIQKEDLVLLYQKEGLTITEVSQKLGYDRRTVHRQLVEYGIPRRASGTMSRTAVSVETLRRMHVDEKKSASEIARELKCSSVTVLNKLKKYGIKVRGRALGNVITKNDLERMYTGEGRTAKEIAEMYECQPGTIHAYMRKLGIQIRRDYSSPEYEEKRRLRADGEQKFRDLKKFLGGSCAVCRRDEVPLAIHHMYYLPNDVIKKNYGRKYYLYHIDLEPLVRDNPKRFRLLCQNCHAMAGLLQRMDEETKERMIRAMETMVEMRKVHATEHSELILPNGKK